MIILPEIAAPARLCRSETNGARIVVEQAFDAIDIRILRELQADGRLSIVDLAARASDPTRAMSRTRLATPLRPPNALSPLAATELAHLGAEVDDELRFSLGTRPLGRAPVTLGLIGLTDLHQMNGLKSVLGTAINGVAVVIFIYEDTVGGKNTIEWIPALAMMGTSVVGGFVAAHYSRQVPGKYVRWLVIVVGFCLAAFYFWKQLT